jgi:hypothetical protein
MHQSHEISTHVISTLLGFNLQSVSLKIEKKKHNYTVYIQLQWVSYNICIHYRGK